MDHNPGALGKPVQSVPDRILAPLTAGAHLPDLFPALGISQAPSSLDTTGRQDQDNIGNQVKLLEYLKAVGD